MSNSVTTKGFSGQITSNEIPSLTCAKLNNAIAYRRIGDTYVIVLTDEGQMCFLNKTAGRIVEILDQGINDHEVPREICRRYDVDEITAMRDYSRIRASFLSLGLLVASQDHHASEATPSESLHARITSADLRDKIKAYCTNAAIPIQAFIEVTPACNLRCTHCYVPQSRASESLLDQVGFENILDQLRDLGCLEVTLTGGEPLVYPHLLSLCEHARRQRFSVIVKTNATLLDDSTLSAFRRMHITEVQVSLYSMEPSVHDRIVGRPGSHAMTVDALSRCRTAGQHFRLSCVVMKSNVRHLEGLTDFALSMRAPIGFDLLVTRRLDGSAGSLQERLSVDDLTWLDDNGIMANVIFEGSTQIPRLEENAYGLSEYPIDDPDSRVCGAACTLVAISACGDVRPCITFPLHLGNVRTQPLREILSDSNEPVRYIRSLRNRSFTTCKDCSIVSACPRCIATIYQETGSPTAKAEAICRIATYYHRYGGPQRPMTKRTNPPQR